VYSGTHGDAAIEGEIAVGVARWYALLTEGLDRSAAREAKAATESLTHDNIACRGSEW
jgi:hypothetical protein